MKLSVNPKNFTKTYVACLNQCFGVWGNEDMYHWVFDNNVFLQADMLVFFEDDKPMAGSAVTYRTMHTNEGDKKISIMTGSWTLPQARGKGCFTQLIKESLAIGHNRGSHALLAFVTETNASYRRLAAAGFIQEPSFYMSAQLEGDGDLKMIVDTPTIRKEIFYKATQQNDVCFKYSFEQWQHQFLDRPSKPAIFSLQDSFVIIENNMQTNRILGIFGNIERCVDLLCGSMSGNVQYFTTNQNLKDVFEKRGFNVIRGCVAVSESIGDMQALNLQSGDRI